MIFSTIEVFCFLSKTHNRVVWPTRFFFTRSKRFAWWRSVFFFIVCGALRILVPNRSRVPFTSPSDTAVCTFRRVSAKRFSAAVAASDRRPCGARLRPRGYVCACAPPPVQAVVLSGCETRARGVACRVHCRRPSCVVTMAENRFVAGVQRYWTTDAVARPIGWHYSDPVSVRESETPVTRRRMRSVPFSFTFRVLFVTLLFSPLCLAVYFVPFFFCFVPRARVASCY